ncbi:hypothetical protein EBR77_01180 [bacterium]|nr:hypothetical protein [bacterium]NBX77842.1 hypothetical protein [bacterium]
MKKHSIFVLSLLSYTLYGMRIAPVSRTTNNSTTGTGVVTASASTSTASGSTSAQATKTSSDQQTSTTQTAAQKAGITDEDLKNAASCPERVFTFLNHTDHPVSSGSSTNTLYSLTVNIKAYDQSGNVVSLPMIKSTHLRKTQITVPAGYYIDYIHVYIPGFAARKLKNHFKDVYRNKKNKWVQKITDFNKKESVDWILEIKDFYRQLYVDMYLSYKDRKGEIHKMQHQDTRRVMARKNEATAKSKKTDKKLK